MGSIIKISNITVMAEQFTQAEKAKRLREIMGRAIKRNKTKPSQKNMNNLQEPNDEDHEELMQKLRETERKYWEKKRA